jgi:hypothetical protein
LDNTSLLDYDVGSSTDLLAVTGAVTLAGSIAITAGPGFGAGTKTIITYTGALTNNTLTIGSTSGGNFSYAIDTATAGQVNLIITATKWSVYGLDSMDNGALNESALYIGGGSPDSLYSRSLANGSRNWSFYTGHGACHAPSYGFSGGTYKIVASAVDWVIGVQDNGTALWPAVNLTGAGSPYVGVNNNNFYVAYNGNLSKRKMADGTDSQTVGVGSISTAADLVVASDYVYAATTNGYVNRYDAGDLTHVSSYGPISGGPRIDLPLLMSGGTLYITPNNGSLYAVTTATMAAKWSLNYSHGGTNTGAAYTVAGRDTIYATATNYVYKIADKSGSGEEKWSFNVLAAVNSGPLFYGATVYFGRNDGRYYAIKDVDGTLRTNWPRSTGNGDASSGPWIDPANNEVIFGTTNGNLDAFPLEP